MNQIKSYLQGSRLILLVFLVVGIATYVSASWYWQNVCAVEGCTSELKLAFLGPIRAAGLVLVLTVLPFLFVPTRYFTEWLKWLSVPIFLFTLWNISSIDPNSSNMFSLTREQAMENYLTVWPALTLFFIAYHWWRSRKS